MILELCCAWQIPHLSGRSQDCFRNMPVQHDRRVCRKKGCGRYCGPVRDFSRESSCCGRFGEAIISCPRREWSLSSPVVPPVAEYGLRYPNSSHVCVHRWIWLSASDKESAVLSHIYSQSRGYRIWHISTLNMLVTMWTTFLDMKNFGFCPRILFMVSFDPHNK
jgi:hypothetical protein